MKKLLFILLLASCVESPKIDKLKHPLIITAEHNSEGVWESSVLVMKNSEGSFTISSFDDLSVEALVDTYKVGDTIK